MENNFSILEDRYTRSILSNTEPISANNLGKLYQFLEQADYEVDLPLKKDIITAIKYLATNLKLLSSIDRNLLFECLIQAKNIDNEYLLLTQGMGIRIVEYNLLGPFDNLCEYDFIENEYEYADGTKYGARLILECVGVNYHLDWLWVVLKIL